MEPFLQELVDFKPSNALYYKWWNYALSLTRDDILLLVRNGLTYQTEALITMIKEIMGGQPMPPTLIKKLSMLRETTNRHADSMR